MGNALTFLYGKCCKPSADEQDSGSLGHHGVSVTNVGVSALAKDLYSFEITSQVPEGLSKHVVSSKKAQAKWYQKLSKAWRGSNPPPTVPEEASRLVVQTLQKHLKEDVEGLLAFYGLPLPHMLVELSAGFPSSLPQGVQYEMFTLPVDAKAVADGDTVTVYVSTEDPREASSVPREVQSAVARREQARAKRDYVTADALQKTIVDAGYRVITIQNKDVLGRKYRIRLRGIDAPEGKMPYGNEAREVLVDLIQGKCLRVLVYGEDQYGRCVADLYCNNLFVQEFMLKKGMAWHYIACDQRPELAHWEQGARAKRVGLWASSNPENPWDWRKNQR